MDTSDIEEQDRLLWEKTKRSDTFIAYNKYVKSFPKGQYVELALQRITDLNKIQEAEEESLWNDMVSIGDHSSIYRYKLTYPNGIHITEANAKLALLKPNETNNSAYNSENIKPVVIVPLTFSEKNYWWLWIPVIGWVPFAIPLILPLGPLMVGFSFSNKMRFVWEAAAHNGETLPSGTDSFIAGFYTLGYNTVLRTYKAARKMLNEEPNGNSRKIQGWNPIFLPLYILCPALVYIPLIKSMQMHWEWHINQSSQK